MYKNAINTHIICTIILYGTLSMQLITSITSLQNNKLVITNILVDNNIVFRPYTIQGL